MSLLEPHREPAGARDLRDGMWMGLLLGPLELPSADRFRAVFVEVAETEPQLRIGLVGDGVGGWRRPDQGIGERITQIVRDIDAQTPDPLGWLMRHRLPDLPVQYVISGDRLALAVDHRLADGYLVTRLTRILLDHAAGRPSSLATSGVLTDPLPAALRHQFGLRPRSWWRIGADILANPAPARGLTDPLSSVGALRTVELVLSQQRLSRIRRDGRSAGNFSMVLGGLTTAALRASGVEFAPTWSMVVDLRRYLPRGQTTFVNFITGLPVAADGWDAALAAAPRINQALDVGRPLASTALAAVMSRLPMPTGSPSPAAAEPALAVSSMGLLRHLEKLPWTAGPEQRQIMACATPGDIRTMGLVAIVVANRLYASFNFYDGSFDADAVTDAVSQIEGAERPGPGDRRVA